jgi:hypothetical protein
MSDECQAAIIVQPLGRSIDNEAFEHYYRQVAVILEN